MRLTLLTLLTLVNTLVLAGCGLPTGLPTTGGCTWTLTGAATTSGTCTVTTVYKGSVDQSDVAVVDAPGSGIALDGASVVIAGKPVTGTFSSGAATSVKGGIVLQNTPTTTQWASTFNDGTPDQGAYLLTLTSATAGLAGSGGDQFFTTHGTITGTAPPSPTASNTAVGTVSFTITF